MNEPTNFVGVVLCGGASRRMRQDKALLELDGLPLAARVASVLRSAGADRILAACGDRPESAPEGLERCRDRIPGAGPLSALLGALDHLNATGPANATSSPTAGALPSPDRGMPPFVVFAACDLPWLDDAAIRSIVAPVCAGASASTGLVDGHPQWHVVALSTHSTASLEAVFADGERSMAGAIGPLDPALVPLAGRVLDDVDTPQAWEQARSSLGESSERSSPA